MTTTTQTRTGIPTTAEEMTAMEKKVQASETYKHAWCVIRITRNKDKHGRITYFHFINFEGVTLQEAEEICEGCNKVAEQYKTTMQEITFHPINPFDNYTLYCQGNGRENPRAHQWDEIKHQYATPRNDRQYD